MDESVLQAIEALRDIVQRSWLTNILQLTAAVLMIGVELCLMWVMWTLVRHVRGLSLDLEVMLANMGWASGKHHDRMDQTRQYLFKIGDEDDEKKLAALKNAKRAGEIAP